ncbi:MAG: P-loop NTPase [Candidatus Omnitrophica bacterium]|nr:P-loop NTPase [Candidatus Omnitrophota bacterium]
MENTDPIALRPERADASPRPEAQIRFVIPVASGKCGVGKSTVSANLAFALAKRGFRVGLMDADVYGPSIPTLMGTEGQPTKAESGKIRPLTRGPIKIISTAFFIPRGEAVIWRGPMLHKMIGDFLNQVDWGSLDYLITDLPPGTGDVQISLCQKIRLTGAVIVSTPQDLAFHVAEKAISMFKKLQTPILGIIENMSGYACSHCGHVEEIFGRGGARKHAEEAGIEFLGEIPLSTDIRITSDSGKPIVEEKPDSTAAKAFFAIADRLVAAVEAREQAGGQGAGPGLKAVTQPAKAEIRMEWTDGHVSLFKAYDLRLACPCAACVDERTGEMRINPAQISKEVYPVKFERVGSYGLGFRWSDGHSTGIYTHARLRALCSCADCQKRRMSK